MLKLENYRPAATLNGYSNAGYLNAGQMLTSFVALPQRLLAHKAA